MNTAYELYRIKREIVVHGKQYEVYRNVTDQYGEITDREFVADINGIFHTEKGYITEQVSDGTNKRTKGNPKILTTFEDGKNIINGDYIKIGGLLYKVTDCNNIQNFDIAIDISLEVVLNGNI